MEVFPTCRMQRRLGKTPYLIRMPGKCRGVYSPSSSQEDPLPVFHPEFGRFMLEATPGKPWGIEFKALLAVEPDMKLR